MGCRATLWERATRWPLAVCLALAVAFGQGANAGEALKIIGVTHSKIGTATKIEFLTDVKATFDLFTLAAPDRLVLDFAGLKWMAPPPEGIPFVKSLRHGVFRPGTARMVMELTAPAEVVAAYALEGEGDNPARLVLELMETDKESFRATAGWPEGARWRPESIAREPVADEIVVLIDPGHGGIDPGASAFGLVEKTVALEFGLVLAERIDNVPGLRAMLSRADDRFIPLRGRLQTARESGAHVMLSLHTDAIQEGSAEGISVYTLSKTGIDAAAEAFAERENRSDVLAGEDLSGAEDDVTRVLIDLARRGTNAESIKLAQAILGSLGADIEQLKTRPHRYGDFYVLKAPDIPSVLVELGFLNTKADRMRMADEEWRYKVADGIASGVRRWIEATRPGFLTSRD